MQQGFTALSDDEKLGLLGIGKVPSIQGYMYAENQVPFYSFTTLEPRGSPEGENRGSHQLARVINI